MLLQLLLLLLQLLCIMLVLFRVLRLRWCCVRGTQLLLTSSLGTFRPSARTSHALHRFLVSRC